MIRSQKVARDRVEYMSETALKILLEQPDPNTRCGVRDRFFMILLYDTGARIQEILDLQLKDIHLNDQTPCIYLTGKGNKTRAVPLMDKTIAHLTWIHENYFTQMLIMKNDHVSLLYPDQRA